MDAFAPDNTAPIPIAISKEIDKWYVYVHFRRPLISDFTIEASSGSLIYALKTIHRHLGRAGWFEKQSSWYDVKLGLGDGRQIQAG